MEEPLLLESMWYVPAVAGVLLALLLWRLSKVIPWQNIALIVPVVAVAEAGLEFLLVKFSKVVVDDPAWHYYLGAALLWTFIVLGSRRLSKIILRPWRKVHVYGLWLIGLSAVSTVGFAWVWLAFCPTNIPTDRALYMALFRGVATAVLVTALAPWFARKRLSSGASRSEFTQQPRDQAQEQAGE